MFQSNILSCSVIVQLCYTSKEASPHQVTLFDLSRVRFHYARAGADGGARGSVGGDGGGGESCVCAHSLSSSVLSAFGFLPLAFGFLQLGGGGIGLLLRGDLLLPLQDAAEPGYEQIEPV